MSDGIIKFVQNENGEFEEYDDTYDIVIHCETAEDRENVISILTAEKMSRDEFIYVLRECFKSTDDKRYSMILGAADQYVDYEYKRRKKCEKIQWGKDICAATGEDTDELPEEVFLSVAEKLEDRMLENNGDLEYLVVQEVVNEFREQEAEDEAD